MNFPEGMHADEIFDSQESDLVDEKRVEMLDLMELFYANKTGKQDAKTKKEIETLNTRLDKQEARIVRVENGLEELTDEVRSLGDELVSINEKIETGFGEMQVFKSEMFSLKNDMIQFKTNFNSFAEYQAIHNGKTEKKNEEFLETQSEILKLLRLQQQSKENSSNII